MSRDTYLQNRYNITEEQYNELLRRQDGKCYCCGQSDDSLKEIKKRLVVDHSHVSGYVRALLCPFCNSIFGKIAENPNNNLGPEQYVLNLLKYIIQHKMEYEASIIKEGKERYKDKAIGLP